MLHATKETLSSFFHSDRVYEIPFFQRRYVWEEENWSALWDNIENIFDIASEHKNSQSASKYKSEHFIGTLINKRKEEEGSWGENNFHLIDGQQRLTTIAIILKALANSCKDNDDLRDALNGCIKFKNISSGEINFRIRHSDIDAPYFKYVMNNEHNTIMDKKHYSKDMSKTDESKIIEAYKYFYEKVSKLSDDNKRNDYHYIILHKVPVIAMLLSQEDDEQEIFDTINSLGVKLTTGELLKNFIFRKKKIKDLYYKYWAPVFEQDEETTMFWDKNKTAGRIVRTNIEVLLYCYLIINTQKEVRLEKLFHEYKNWFNGFNGKDVDDEIKFLTELSDYAKLYREFPHDEELNEIAYNEVEKRFFLVIQELQITTAYPLILFIYKTFSDADVRKQFLAILESYLVRRNICRLPGKNYNNLFLSLLQKMQREKLNVDGFRKILNSYDDPSNIFPDDKSFYHDFNIATLINRNSRIILFMIALYQVNSDRHDIMKLSMPSYSVEHIMPKKWETHWGGKSFDEARRLERNHALKTLGNLTLTTKNLNSVLKNNPWDKKRATLKEHSHLKITTKYLDEPNWNEAAIEKRGKDLAEIALSIWKKQ